jgi:hypothetical protein
LQVFAIANGAVCDFKFLQPNSVPWSLVVEHEIVTLPCANLLQATGKTNPMEAALRISGLRRLLVVGRKHRVLRQNVLDIGQQ